MQEGQSEAPVRREPALDMEPEPEKPSKGEGVPLVDEVAGPGQAGDLNRQLGARHPQEPAGRGRELVAAQHPDHADVRIPLLQHHPEHARRPAVGQFDRAWPAREVQPHLERVPRPQTVAGRQLGEVTGPQPAGELVDVGRAGAAHNGQLVHAPRRLNRSRFVGSCTTAPRLWSLGLATGYANFRTKESALSSPRRRRSAAFFFFSRAFRLAGLS